MTEDLDKALAAVDINPAQIQIGKKIGNGSTAAVFRGQYSGKDVAIKEIFASESKAAEMKQELAFQREVAIMSKVKHENLVAFYGVCFSTHPLRLVTEFCAGGNLFQLLHMKPDVALCWGQSFKMCRDVANAMDYLHSFSPKIIHRDLKSLNLLLAQEVGSFKDVPLLKVSDFGMAKMREETDAGTVWYNMTNGAGTCHWMAPEVITGSYNEKADVYSYGIVIFEICCREIPFEDEDGKDVVSLIQQGARPDLDAIHPDCPEVLQKLMPLCWAHNPAKRPSFTQVLKALATVDMGPKW
eukprot:CAMPEP_0178396814 /NCGR_PEP_ID=MMETSP0689_2-20121128/13920_1 /TAXON_ID=160604 /ORGANISM="Amphidinium massartii, Strain CS-259" /LENGTH=297 /DNA_ID=CAMNT_0020017495 /DNA_START=1 /DNA_END=891 /DNA_ORIENTATION=-